MLYHGYVEEYYDFQIDQLYKDQNLLNAIIHYDYSCVSEQCVVQESKLVDLFKNFFKWIVQKFTDMINFIKKIFSKANSVIGSNIKNIKGKAKSLYDYASKEPFVLKNQKVMDMNYACYDELVKCTDFRSCKNLDIGQRILDLFLDTEKNMEDIKLNTKIFNQIVQEKGYMSAVNNENLYLTYFNAVIHNLKNGKQDTQSYLKDQSAMKKIVYSSIYLGDQHKDIIDIDDVTFDDMFVIDIEQTTDHINTGLNKLNNSKDLNEKNMELSKKKIKNIDNRLGEGIITEELFQLFKSFSSNLITLFNYNRDMIVYLLEISNTQLNYMNSILEKAKKHYGLV